MTVAEQGSGRPETTVAARTRGHKKTNIINGLNG
jgi:hypothetical protein